MTTRREKLLRLCEKMQKACDLAHTEITKLASGKRKWEMCVPVQPTDSDITLQEPLSIFQKEFQQLFVALIDENEKLRGVLELISNNKYLAYSETGGGSYGTGVTDGHRLAAEWARKALTTKGPLEELLEKGGEG